MVRIRLGSLPFGLSHRLFSGVATTASALVCLEPTRGCHRILIATTFNKTNLTRLHCDVLNNNALLHLTQGNIYGSLLIQLIVKTQLYGICDSGSIYCVGDNIVVFFTL